MENKYLFSWPSWSDSLISCALSLLQALWRSPELHHFLGIKPPSSGFRNLLVKNANEAQTLAAVYSKGGADVYFACAEFATPDNRTANNAVGAWSFWMDFDVGEEKAAAGKGYTCKKQVLAALDDFSVSTGLPQPNILVASGGGIHAYTVLDTFLPSVQWVDAARKLKTICQAHGLQADPSRTADIASVLRVPGSLNYKYGPPAEVELLRIGEKAIPWPEMKTALEAAHDRLAPLSPQAPQPLPQQTQPDVGQPCNDLLMRRLEAALRTLDPDCEEQIWKIHVIAPMARLAMSHPDYADELKRLAHDWSSGELRGEPSRKWTMPGQLNSQAGKDIFDGVWRRFLEDHYVGRMTTVATIFHDAKQAGWVEDAFNPIAVDPVPSDLDRLREATKTDFAAPLTEKAVEVLKALRHNDQAEYQRVRAELKAINSKVNLGALDRATKSTVTQVRTHHGYAQGILDRLTVDNWRPVGHGGVLYAIDPESGLWVPSPPTRLERLAAELYDGQEQCRRAVDYRNIAEHALSLVDNPAAFADAPLGIACQAGFYRIVGDQIRLDPLTPAHHQRVMLSFTPEKQPTPQFDNFLAETFWSKQPQEAEQQIQLVQESAGAIMIGAMPRYQKALLWYDRYGRAGKGTLERIVRALIPPELVSAISPFKWAQDYHVAAIAGKRLNSVGEMPEETPIPAAEFKTVLGGDQLTGRHPHYRPFTFANEAAHLFMSNHLITTRDHSEAFYSRWLLVEFPNSLLRSGRPIDPSLPDRIIAEELPGIAYWALEGAARLLRQGHFSPSIVHDRLMVEWRRTSNSASEFVYEECQVGNRDFKVKRADLYKAYCDWCSETRRKACSKARFKELLLNNNSYGITLSEINGYDTFRGIRVKVFDPIDLTLP